MIGYTMFLLGIAVILQLLFHTAEAGSRERGKLYSANHECDYDPKGKQRFSLYNFHMDCKYPANYRTKQLRQYVKGLERSKHVRVYYPLKVIGENRIIIIAGATCPMYFEIAKSMLDVAFECTVDPIMDYYDFAWLTLNVTEVPEEPFPVADLKGEPLVAIWRTIVYPEDTDFESFKNVWREHTKKSILGKKKGQNKEVFHFVGQEKEMIMRVFDPETVDFNIFNRAFLVNEVTAGISHFVRYLVHLDLLP
ncbi:unnamed protein product [Owenia fusiformis]|uniref:Uncharacterized protein n=1 Tax=Owenia fusiformis TaxID=6347 RepID=A0A8S4Q621_OWEFU|nr:unnamed protein product [Owenia fusiformis]